MSAACTWCGIPTAGARWCSRCVRTLEIALVNIRAYAGGLDVIRARQARYGDPAPLRRGGGPLPLPVDARFVDRDPGHPDDPAAGVGSNLEADVANTLTGWARVVLEEQTALAGPACRLACLHVSCARVRRTRPPADTVADCCRYLAGQRVHIAAAEYADQLLDELLNLERRLRRFVDRPPERWYAGPCTAGLRALEAVWFCGAELYADLGEPTVTCRDCGVTYDLAERRAWLLAAAEDRLENAATIARAVVVWTDYDRGESRLVRRISDWARRGRLGAREERLVDGRRRSLYRVGDVLDLLADEARESAERGA